MKRDFYHNRLVAALLICIIIFSSGHALQTIIPRFQQSVLISAVILVPPILCTVRRDRINAHSTSFYLFIGIILFTLLTHFGDGLKELLVFACIITTAYGITLVYPFGKMVNVFLKIMTAVSVIAIPGYILVNTTNYLGFLPEMTNINGALYTIGVVFNYVTYVKSRNCGMFWEPGIFASYLLLAIIFEVLFKEKKPSKTRLLLFSFALFTANSTAGYALWFLCVALILVRRVKRKRFAFAVSIFLLSVVLLTAMNLDAVLIHSGLAENEYFGKLLSDNLRESTRVNAVVHNLKMFASSPLYGVGISEALENIKYVADTSTSTYMMSVYGILAVFYTVFWVGGVLKIKNLDLASKAIVVCVLLAIVNKEPHTSITFTWVLLFFLTKNISSPQTILIRRDERRGSQNVEKPLGGS